ARALQDPGGDRIPLRPAEEHGRQGAATRARRRGTRVTRRERNGREAGLKIDELKRICVVGAGLMGRQIALNAAHHGFAVRLWDANAEQVRAAERWTDEYIAGRIEKGRWTKEEAATARARLDFAANVAEAAAEADL